MLWSNIEQTKEALSPEYKHQRDRDRRNREGIDQNQANVAKSIEDNVTAQTPGGDPAPKRNPKGKFGTALIGIGLGAEAIKEGIEGGQLKENIPQQEDTKLKEENSKNQDEKGWWQRIKEWFD